MKNNILIIAIIIVHALFNKGCMTSKNSSLEYHNQGNHHYQFGRYYEAIEFYNKAIAISPDLPESYNNRGLAYTNLGNFVDALTDFDIVIKLNPNNAIAYYNRGNVKLNFKDFFGAIQDYNKAIEIDPNDKEIWKIYYNRGQSNYFAGNKDGLCSDWKKAHELTLINDIFSNNDSLYIKNLKSEVEVILKNDSNNIDANLKLGFCYLKFKEYENALSYFDKVIKIDPNSDRVYEMVGITKLILKDTIGACIYWQKSIENSRKKLFNFSK
ncbi:MAG: yrrB 2 [Ignavibacteria bacterium]|nr:yrrB 2 [Ignavibacteria bacterium]